MTASSNSYSASSGAPFSAPYHDDAVLGVEFPFPLNRHSNVIIENIGVKEAKNINKGRESPLNKHITTVRPSLYPHSGPTSSLALRSLRQNTAPLIPLARQTTSSTSTGPSSSRKDAWGCVHLGAADCELSIAFLQTSHYEAWDLGTRSMQDRIAINKIRNRVLLDLARNQLAWVDGAQ
ncbi:hypothetical protein BYT27DRAFT_7206384 [Phlegmacium glaucopus]|nr:hypothetical protein BYT27DRAFT_7206384 [Phlegmacium glaucopus]